jgi:ABC-type branched-subunit amino acid transport system ATPase component
MSNSIAVEVSGLDFGYGGPLILNQVNLELPVGSRTLLVGSNGAGSEFR